MNNKSDIIFPMRMKKTFSCYIYSTDNYLIFTTLKQGTTFLSNLLYGQWRPHFYYDINTNSISYSHSDSDDHEFETIDDSKKNDIVKKTILEFNNIVNSKSNKKICFIIRNPFERMISSIIEDTISSDSFFERFDRKYVLNSILKKEGLSKLEFEYKTLYNDRFYWLPKINNISKWFGSEPSNILFKYFISEWYKMRIGEYGFNNINGHLVSHWEGLVYSILTDDKIPSNNIKILDIDKDNLTELLNINTEKNIYNSNTEIIKSQFRNQFSKLNNEKYIMRFIDYDIWFYNLINNRIKK